MKYLVTLAALWLAACTSNDPNARSHAPSDDNRGYCLNNPVSGKICTNRQGKKVEPWQISPN